MSSKSWLVSSVFSLGVCSSGFATLVVGPFSQGGVFDDHDIASTESLIDPSSGVMGVFTTTRIIDFMGAVRTTAGSGDFLNTVANGNIGINSDASGEASASRFENNEAWGFMVDTPIEFVGIDMAAFTTADSEAFVLQSDDWIGLGVTPGHAAVVYNSAAGSFTLSDKDASDVFDLNDLTGGVTLGVSANTEILISYVATDAGQEGTFDSFSVNLVPEPSGVLLLGVGGLVGLMRRRR